MTFMTTSSKAANRPQSPRSALKVLAGGIAAAVTLSGCAIQRIDNAHDHSGKLVEDAARHVRQMNEQKDLYSSRGSMRQMPGIWVDTTPLPMNNKSLGARPTALDCPITFNPKSPVTLAEFARVVTNLCGMPVNVTSDAIAALTDGVKGSDGGVNTGGGNTLTPNSPLPPPTIDAGMSSGVMAGGASSMFSSMDGNSISGVTWTNKPVSGLLDLVTARLGLGWKFVDGSVSIFYLDTRVMQLFAIPGKTKMETKVKSGSSESGGSSGGNDSGGFSNDGSEQSTELSFETDVIGDIMKTLQTMVTPSLGRLSVSPSTGTITVTDRPDVLRRIETYVDAENKRITRQVLLNVKVLSVTLTDTDSAGLDWSVVYNRLGRYGMSFGGGAALGGGSAAQGFNGSLGIIDGTSRFDGSKALIDALSTQGRVSTLASPSVVTMNLKPAPILVGRQTSYLAKVSTTAIGGSNGSNSTQELTPGTITTGFNMTLLPYLMKGPEMLLQYSINLSDLTDLKEISSGENRIQLPEIDNRIFSQSVRLRSGQTLVLSGFDQAVTDSDKAGVGDPNFWLLGGKGSRQMRRDVIVVLITPVISD